MRLFTLEREYDTGSAKIAQGVVFDDGSVALRFLTKARSTAVYFTLHDVESVHLGEDTSLIWMDGVEGD